MMAGINGEVQWAKLRSKVTKSSPDFADAADGAYEPIVAVTTTGMGDEVPASSLSGSHLLTASPTGHWVSARNSWYSERSRIGIMMRQAVNALGRQRGPSICMSLTSSLPESSAEAEEGEQWAM